SVAFNTSFRSDKRFDKGGSNSVDRRAGPGDGSGPGGTWRDRRPHRGVGGKPRDYGQRPGSPAPRGGVSGWGKAGFQPGTQAGRGGGHDRAEADPDGTGQQPLSP